MFLLALKAFMALGAKLDNYGQFLYNNIFDVFHFPTMGNDFNKYIGIIYGNSETKDISGYKFNQWTKL